VFDDAAFSYFMLTILAMILTPWSLSKLCDAFGICQDDEDEEVRKVDDVKGYQVAIEKSEDDEEKPKLFRRSNIIFGLLWLFLLVIVIRLPGSGESFQTFHPFEILEIDIGASDREIKKAYRKLSLKFHPDKNPGDEVAAKQFILISKAYQTLTDPQTKKNWEEYGNPDGYQGTSVTIGLPSFLTDKNNEFPVLFAYFIIIIIIPPILVWMWWKNAKEMGPEGIMHKTIQIYYFFIDKNWSINLVHKFTALYACSAEFAEMLEKIAPPRHMQEWYTLKKAIEANGKKVEFGGNRTIMNLPRVQAGSLLLQAHLRRIPVPKIFEKELKTMLKYTKKLIPGMVGTTWRYPGKQAFVMPCFSVIKFNQMLVQAMWAHDPIFMQLPHDCHEDIRKRGRKMRTWERFLAQKPEQKKKLFKDYTEDQQKEIEAATETIPQVDMQWKCGVEDEKEICTLDLVTVDVKLFRKGFFDEKSDSDKCETSDVVKKGDGEKNTTSTTGDVDEDDDGDISDEEDQMIDALDFVVDEDAKKKKRKKRQALAPFFPYVKKEGWYIILVTPKSAVNKLVTDVRYVELDESTDCQLRFRVPEKKGKYRYEIHAICDAYVGCDIEREFEVIVREDKKRKTEEDFQREKEMRDREEEDEMKRMEEEYPPVWYYCYYSSFSEMVINGIVFALLCVFIFNFLHSRGYWQDYVQPVIDVSYNVTNTYVYDLDSVFYPPEKEMEDEFEVPEPDVSSEEIETDDVADDVDKDMNDIASETETEETSSDESETETMSDSEQEEKPKYGGEREL